MKILLFGSSGAFGTAFETICKEKTGIDLIGMDHSRLEITNTKSIERAIEDYKPSVIINAVAVVGINPCEIDPQMAFAVNTIAVSGIARLCHKNDILLVQPGTHSIFDGNKNDCYTEDDIPNPANIYSLSKIAAEYLVSNICPRHYIVRFPTLFGNRKNNAVGFADKVLQGIYSGKELKIADDKLDSPTYTIDAANQILSMMTAEKPYGTYHIANSGKASYYNFAVKMAEFIGIKANIIPAKDSDFPALAYKPLKTAIKSIKLEPLRPWEDALREYINGFKKRDFQNS